MTIKTEIVCLGLSGAKNSLNLWNFLNRERRELLVHERTQECEFRAFLMSQNPTIYRDSEFIHFLKKVDFLRLSEINKAGLIYA